VSDSSDGARVNTDIDVLVEDPLTRTSWPAAIRDLSLNGMRIEIDQYLPKGTRYGFTMKREPFLSVRAEVRWVRNYENDRYNVGLLFVDVPDDELARLEAYLETTAP